MADPSPAEINLSDVADVFRRNRPLFAVVPTVFFLLALTYLHLTEPRYTVTLKVTPTASAVGSLPAGLTSIADLTGLAVPGANENIDFELYLEGLKSRETSAAVTANATLMRQLFHDEWNDAAGEWQRPPGVLPRIAAIAKAVLGYAGNGWHEPDAGRVNEFLDEELKIIRDRNGPVVSITIEDTRPQVARDLLSVLHEVVDSALRQKELDRTSAYVNYLRDQILTVAVTEYRQALNDILAEQEKRRMVASSNLPFAAEPFGAPTISVEPTSPRPLLTIFSALAFGFLLALVAALGRHQRQRAINEPV